MALTKKDFSQIQKLIKQSLEENNKVIFGYMNKIFATKEDLNDLREEFSHLPTKDEFYESQDKLAARLQKIDQQTDILPARVTEHEVRIEKIESHLGLAA